MGQTVSTAAIIGVASQLKNQVATLHAAYLRLPEVLQAEHEAIRSSNLSVVEQTCDDKVKLGEMIEQCFSALRVAADELKAWRRRLLDGAPIPVVTLKDCVQTLDDLCLELASRPGIGTFGTQVLQHQIQGLRQLVQAFDAQHKRVQPLIEMNRYLTEKMLTNYQDSYRFWVAIVEETESAYNAQGVQKSQGRLSAFKVTA